MTAAAVISCFGLFGVSMSTQGGRSYVMDKTNEVLGMIRQLRWKMEDRLITGNSEEEARSEIEENFKSRVSCFYIYQIECLLKHTN